MKIFKCIVSGDEFASDAFPLHEKDDGFLLEVDCKLVTMKEGEEFVLEGANPSAEDPGEALGGEAGTKTVNNVVEAFRLQQLEGFDKGAYKAHISGYMKKIKAHLEETNPERAKDFQKKAPELVKRILGQFKDYDVYCGENMDMDGTLALLNFREDGMTPFFTLFKDGLKEMKY